MTLSGQVVRVPRGSIRLTFPLADAVGCTRTECSYPRDADNTKQMGKHTVNGHRRGFMEENLTQFYVLIISEDEDDVGSHVAYVAVSLQARPEAVSRQVPRALGRRERSRKD